MRVGAAMLRRRVGRDKDGGGMRQIDLDGLRLFALTDCAPAPAECAYSFPDAALADRPEVAARWFGEGCFRTRFGPFLLRGGGGDVLVDCGLGPGDVGYFPNLRGDLPAALAAAGSSLAAIADVVFTHLHVDHVGWAPHLPHARFHVAAAEWAHWSGLGAAGLPHHTEAVARCVAPLAAAGRLATLASDAEPVPGLRLLAATGHTPGHHAVLVGGRVLIAGDAWHNPAQIAVPAWCHRADMDKPEAMATRTRLAAMARDRGWIVAAGHFTDENAFGRIAAGPQGLAFAPLSA
jgi:glyoxylase-like metal-dependent hydrolase (beta-lactamase superfamily II)